MAGLGGGLAVTGDFGRRDKNQTISPDPQAKIQMSRNVYRCADDELLIHNPPAQARGLIKAASAGFQTNASTLKTVV
jgi:hypothetical protein